MIKLIDADKLKEELTKNYKDDELAQVAEIKSFIDIVQTVDAIIIPKDATNGDMIKALFPNNKFEEDKFWDGVWTSFTGKEYEHHLMFPVIWWNAPYKKGEE